tara:strand:- start:317 stop:727 length:411 start_codon:yes stop_codon:yes gene_type:complete
MNNEKFLQKYRTDKQSTWIKVKTTDGREFYFTNYGVWAVVKQHCKDESSFIEEFFLQFRSHEVEIEVGDADGFYFVRSILGQMGGDSKNYFTVGIIKGDTVHKKMYIIPELVEEKSYEDDIESCFDEAIIYNEQKT